MKLVKIDVHQAVIRRTSGVHLYTILLYINTITINTIIKENEHEQANSFFVLFLFKILIMKINKEKKYNELFRGDENKQLIIW